MERPSLGKRKAPLNHLQRRVKARKYEPEPEEVFSEEEESSNDGSHSEDSSEGDSDEEEVDKSENGEDEDESESDPEIVDASQVSFGALAKAQATLPNARRKKGQQEGDGDSDDNSDAEQQQQQQQQQEEAPGWESSFKNKKIAKVAGRTNKHAPAEQSSKRPVGRRREVVSSATPVAARDPRFDPILSAGATPADEDRTRRAYAFLDEYQETEMARLKEAIQTAKAVAKKAKVRGVGEAAATRELEELKRALASMQDRRRAQKRRDEEKNLIAEHRRREKELVKEGKKSAPFYLKRSEQKKQLLVDRFAGMKKGQVDHTIERRRKKLASRERRGMPMARRERPE